MARERLVREEIVWVSLNLRKNDLSEYLLFVHHEALGFSHANKYNWGGDRYMDKRICLVLAATLLCSLKGYSQQASFTDDPIVRSISFVVVVTTKSGHPVTDLQQQDFKVFDNNSVRPIRGFRVITESKAPINASAASIRSIAANDNLHLFLRYEITFDRAKGRRPNDYHQVGILVDRPDLTVRTRDGYYARTD
jgi:hypothetical protein